MTVSLQSSVEQAWPIHFIDAQHNNGVEAIKDLVNGKKSILVLRKALQSDFLQNIVKKIYEHKDKIEKKQYVNGALTTFGPYLAKHLNSLDDYFNSAAMTDHLFNVADDLRQITRDALCNAYGFNSLAVAKEQNGKHYSPAVVRIHSDGVSNPLHNDNIMRDAKHTGLILKNLAIQLSCIVCIQECDEGGELQHYHKRWESIDEMYKIPNGLGYYSDVINDVESSLFKPQTGDVYLIDPTHYHEIHKVLGRDRITLGFFMGFFDHSLQDGIVWS